MIFHQHTDTIRLLHLHWPQQSNFCRWACSNSSAIAKENTHLWMNEWTYKLIQMYVHSCLCSSVWYLSVVHVSVSMNENPSKWTWNKNMIHFMHHNSQRAWLVTDNQILLKHCFSQWLISEWIVAGNYRLESAILIWSDLFRLLFSLLFAMKVQLNRRSCSNQFTKMSKEKNGSNYTLFNRI